jgi:hypothetical protein
MKRTLLLLFVSIHIQVFSQKVLSFRISAVAVNLKGDGFPEGSESDPVFYFKVGNNPYDSLKYDNTNCLNKTGINYDVFSATYPDCILPTISFSWGGFEKDLTKQELQTGTTTTNINKNLLTSSDWTTYSTFTANRVSNSISYENCTGGSTITYSLTLQYKIEGDCNVTEINDEKVVQKVIVYPNPTSDYLYITNSNNATYTLSNLQGISLLEGEIKQNMLSVSDIPSGIYHLRVANNHFVISKK